MKLVQMGSRIYIETDELLFASIEKLLKAVSKLHLLGLESIADKLSAITDCERRFRDKTIFSLELYSKEEFDELVKEIKKLKKDFHRSLHKEYIKVYN